MGQAFAMVYSSGQAVPISVSNDVPLMTCGVITGVMERARVRIVVRWGTGIHRSDSEAFAISLEVRWLVVSMIVVSSALEI